MERLDRSSRYVVAVNELDTVLGNAMLSRLWMGENFLFQGD